MVYRSLGSTGLSVSVIGIGTWQLGGEWGRSFSLSEVEAIFDRARACGITLIDTAECYGDHLSERLVGRAVRRDRERWVIATKFGHRYTTPFQREQLWGVDDVRRQLEDSLAALGIDTIDVYQFHSGTRDAFENDALWSMLEAQKKAGKLRHVGISIGNSIPREEQERQAARARQVGAECLQVVYNRMQRLPESVVLPLCARENLGVLARVPLASGYLSGKYREGAVFGPEDFRSTKTREELNRMAVEAERIRKEEVPPGVSMSAWALAWCLQNPTVTAVIPGCKSPEQVAQNAAAADLLPAG
ncbi:MAG TPA: aldo/keto reductase [Spirochaetia bacterium]|nr:aldo/keto reductase [Spirochaetia bacterium]